MKHINILLYLFFFTVIAFGKNNTGNHLQVEPKQPKQGQEISFTYNSLNTGLQDAQEINAVVFIYTPKQDVYNNDYVKAYDVPLKKVNAGWEGNIKPATNATALYIKFYKDNITDTNKGEGYSIYFKDKKNKDITESRLAKADMLAGKGFLLGIEPDFAQALSIFNEEFKTNPQLKRHYLEQYVDLLFLSKVPHINELVNNEVKWLEQQPEITENEIQLLITLFRRLNEKEKANVLIQELQKRNPNHDFFGNELATAYRNEQDEVKKGKILKTIESGFPDHSLLAYTFRKMAASLSAKGDIAGFKNMLREYPSANTADIYNTFAEGLLKNNANLSHAEEFAAKAYRLAKIDLNSLKDPKMTLISENEWLKRKEDVLVKCALNYSKVHIVNESYEEALPLLKEAFALTQANNNKVIEEYTAALQKYGDYKSAQLILENRIAQAKGTDKMRSLLEQGLSKKEAAEVNTYISDLELSSIKLLKQELSKNIIDAEAPSFSLLDLSGKEISLASLRGKVVVIDFWATWCRPCIAAFPAMQRTIEAFNEDKDVVFLFVNTLENGDDKEKKAGDLIKKKGYDFQVLMDNESKMAENYGAKSIPTKFVIDGNGKIKFRSEGFDGNVAKAEKELRAMIELAKQY